MLKLQVLAPHHYFTHSDASFPKEAAIASRKEPLDAPTIDVLRPFMRLPLEVPTLLRGEPNES